jgi:hypothetical protein
MKKKASLNFNNVCNIRTFLAISIQNEIKSRREAVKYWGATSGLVKLQNNRIRDMIGAYRASQSIEIVS